MVYLLQMITFFRSDPAMPLSVRLRTLLKALLAALALWGVPALAEDRADADYHAALEQARAGQYDVALTRLQTLATSYPDRPRYFFDYVTVLVWAGHDASALALLPRIQTEADPVYLIEALGHAARNMKEFALATRLYNTVLRRDPERLASVAGLALAQAGAGKPMEALTIIETRRQQNARDPQLLDALQVVADAFLAQREPKRARDLYRQILQQRPDDFSASLGLFYALIDSEDHAAALVVIDQLAARQPETTVDPASGLSQTNPRWQRVQFVAAMARAYTDNLPEAQQRLEHLAAAAPTDAAPQETLGYVYLWRGWPRRALDSFDRALALKKDSRGARIGRVQALQELSSYSTANAELQVLQGDASNVTDLQRAQRRRDLHALRELRLTVARGFGSGSGSDTQQGSRSLDLDSYLFSTPYVDRWRAFLHGRLSSADLTEGYEQYRRVGAGVEYRASDLSFEAELDRDPGAANDTGAQLRLTCTPDDHWLYGLGLDSFSDDVPLRARFYGIHARSLDTRLDYRFSESRRSGARLGMLDFTDGNQRLYTSGYFLQRLVNEPAYKLDGTLNLYVSHNTRAAAPYFNPRNDLSLNLSLDNEWLLWRRYEQSFRHRVGVTVGSYRQQDFATVNTWDVRYEQQWNPDDKTELRYGVSRGRPVYDGRSEYNTRLYLSLGVRF